MTGPAADQVDELLSAARDARERAYAPYSGFSVGAAVLAEDGRVVSGANIENASYGLSMCAERNAIHRAAADGVRRILAVGVAGPAEAPTWPCGACRQVIQEFGPDALIVSEGKGGARDERRLPELLPDAFGPADLA